ncbi:MAG: hypothetical protein C5B49_09795 [Bdellovibrio sp.]|nr:MAG: hypothetical protein C5B49_09795 [Bdellovibrio sp.]
MVSGSCQAGATVNYSNAATGSTSCSGTYSFTVNKSTDGTYNLSISQTDPAGNVSPSASFQWIRNTAPPSTPTITSPASNPYYSNGNGVTIAGGCTNGDTVFISGSMTSSVACASGTYAFTDSHSVDGTYTYSILQTNSISTSSPSASFSWTRMTVVPATPTITSPASNPLTNNANSITISGGCQTNATVNLSGSATSSATCVASSYSMTINKSADGTYDFSVSQTDQAGNASGSITQVWTRDTVAPAAPTVTKPTSNPYTSGDTNVTVQGDCEATATVHMAGDSAQNQVCPGTAVYSFDVSKTVDGTYNYTLTQTDTAGNTSAATNFQWTRDTTVPFTPLMTSPSADPCYSNTSSITLVAICDATISPTAAVVNLSGDLVASDVTSPAGSLSQDCPAGGTVTFVVSKPVDGTYNFFTTQYNPNNGLSSASDSQQWIRITTPPAAPTITNPSTNPFTAPGNLTISGGCQNNATVNLTGDSTQSLVCSSSSYTFTVVKSSDATYNFTLKQTDLAGNVSTATTLQWIRNSNSLTPPTITTPSTNPYISNSTSLVLSGACTAGYLVTLSGVSASAVTTPAGSLNQTCNGSGTYSYIIAETTNQTYSLSLTQTFNSVTSSAATLSWTLDTVAPIASFSSTPAATNLNNAASFSFTSNESGSEVITFKCKLDTGSYASCTSPVTYSSLTNASHTFSVIATDQAGNAGSAVSYSWTQAAYNAIALYHLDSASPTTDSGNFTQVAGYNNNLTAGGTPTNNASGKFAQAITFGSNNYYSAADNATQALAPRTMTVEGWVRVTSLPSSTGNYYTLVSKNGSSGNYGWELRLLKASNTKSALQLAYSLNGTTLSTVSSTSFTVNTNTWYYFAMTWNLGTVKFYMSSSSNTSRGSTTIGSNLLLFATSAPLRLGANPTSGTGTSQWLNGSLDDVRWSQMIRTITFPSAAFTAD